MLPRAQRLTRSADVRAVLRRGHRRAGELVVVHVLRRDDDEPGRLAVVASRRVGGAVQRNRAKRLLRAAAAALGVADGVDVALVARRGAVESTSTAVADELGRLFPAGIGASTGVRS